MKMFTGLLFLSALLLVGCQEGGNSTAKKIKEGATEAVNAPSDYVGANLRAKQQATATTAKATVTKAIQMFKASEGRNPASLDELIQNGYLVGIPDLPKGASFDYDPQSGTATLQGY